MALEFFAKNSALFKEYRTTDEQIVALKTCIEGDTSVADATGILTAYPSDSPTPLELQQRLAGLWTLLNDTAVGLPDAQPTIISILKRIRTLPWRKEPKGEGEEFMSFDNGFYWRELTDWANNWADNYNHYGAQCTIEKSQGKERQRREANWISANTYTARLATADDDVIASYGAALDRAGYITMRDLEKKENASQPVYVEAAAELFIHAARELCRLVEGDLRYEDIHTAWTLEENWLLGRKEDPSEDKWQNWKENWAELMGDENLSAKARTAARQALEAMNLMPRWVSTRNPGHKPEHRRFGAPHHVMAPSHRVGPLQLLVCTRPLSTFHNHRLHHAINHHLHITNVASNSAPSMPEDEEPVVDRRRLIFDDAASPKDQSWWDSLAFKVTAPLLIVLTIFMLAPQLDFLFNLGATDMRLSKALAVCPALAMARNITLHKDEPLMPTPLPKPHAASDGEQIIHIFQTLGRSTVWKNIANITFEGDTFEPEGMMRLGDDRYVVSSGHWTERTEKYGKIINGTDRTAGKGFAHLMVYNGKGELVADATITKEGEDEYHNGGIDFDGQYIWGTIAQYRPNSTAYVYRVDPNTLVPERVLNYADHLGGVVHDTRDNLVTALNWGGRNASTWDLNTAKTGCDESPKPKRVVRNPSYFIDYQDCKWLGHSKFYGGKSVMLCSGVATIGGYNLGGIALVDVETMIPLAEIPIELESALGVRLTQNPMDVSVKDGKLRLYLMPDQHNSTLYIYEAQPDSPFQYGGGR
ncbi:hypothetical protein FDECE_8229 [Fusarium decemcellulare]|nr:hypothetical protein FDECE_8229 [Fusarium decemcellulare]